MRVNQRLFQAIHFFFYHTRARGARWLHSPFLYDLHQHVFTLRTTPAAESGLIAYEHVLRKSSEAVPALDLGAGSSVASAKRTVQSHARLSASPRQFRRLLWRLGCRLQAQHVLELGSSLGLTTAYLARVPGATVWSLEGHPALLELAKQQPGAQKVHWVEGDIDQTLQPTLDAMGRVDLAYLDANHTEEATLRYWQQLRPYLHAHSAVVVDDIHWSPGMWRAWQAMRTHPSVRFSIDCWEAGLLFFRPSQSPHHITLRW